MTDTPIILHYAPQSRAFSAHVLLEELGVPYELSVLDLKAGDQRRPAYLAVNPLGKVPAVSHRGNVITEQVAVFLYLADLYPAAGLAPAFDEPDRGPYLRWFAFYGACFEPALVDKALKREPMPLSTSPYGDYESVVRLVNDLVSPGPWILGDRFSALDILWGAALDWTTRFGILERTPAIGAFIDRVSARPAYVRARAHQAAILAAREATAQG